MIKSLPIENNLKGWFGEFFTKRALSEITLKKPTYCEITEGYDGEEEIEFLHWGYPDYHIANTNIFIEVKTGKEPRLEKNQRAIFFNLLTKGNRIFLIRPIINIELLKIEIVEFKCYELVINKDIIKSKRINFEVLKEKLKKERSNEM